jgi:IclR family transcriptional regulator, KDG regulon repressor
MVRREKTNYIIQSVSHALDVLEQFTGEPDELGVTELSKRLKLHKNNVFRLLATLEARGYIEQNKATENYRLSVSCLRIGQRFVTQMGLLRQARPVMVHVVKASRETAFIAVLRNGTVVPLDAVEADQAVRLVWRVGDFLPLHCTAAGKIHLAFADDELRASQPETLQKFTERTILDRHALTPQLKKIGENGYAVDLGEHIEDVRSVAVAIRDYTRAVVGSLAIAGPAYRLSQERIDKEITPLMLKAGRELSTRLGFADDK